MKEIGKIENVYLTLYTPLYYILPLVNIGFVILKTHFILP